MSHHTTESDVERAVNALASNCPEDTAVAARFKQAVSGVEGGAAQVAQLAKVLCNITLGADPGVTRLRDIFATEAVRNAFFVPLVQHATSAKACQSLSSAMINITSGTDAAAARRRDIFATESISAGFFVPLVKNATSAKACQSLSSAMYNVTRGNDAAAARRRDVFATEAVRNAFFVPLVQHATSVEACQWLSSALCNITDFSDTGAARRRDVFATEAVRNAFFVPLVQRATSAEACQWLSSALINITSGTDAAASRRSDIFATESISDAFFVPLGKNATSAKACQSLSSAMYNITRGSDVGVSRRRDIFATEAVRDGFFLPLVKKATSAKACQSLSSAIYNITRGNDVGVARRRDIFATETVRNAFFVALVKQATSAEACQWLSSAMINITNGTDAAAVRRRDIFATESISAAFFVALVKQATSAEACQRLSSAMINITRGSDVGVARRREVFATEAIRDAFFIPVITQSLIDDCSSGVAASVAAANKLLSLLRTLIGDAPGARLQMLSLELSAAVLRFADFSGTSDAARALLPVLRTFLQQQHPLCSTAPVSKTVISNDTKPFWDLEDALKAGINGHNDDYVKSRTDKGLRPLSFILVGATAVANPVLEKRFEVMKSIMGTCGGYSAKELRERWGFHGTRPKNIDRILATSLLPFGHPRNPCKHKSDDGWFGVNTGGVYVGRYVDYVLKYSHHGAPLKPDEEVDVIMFKTLPGKSKHIDKITPGLQPTPGFDSHSSPDFLEWYLFESAQLCPTHVLRVRAVENTRTKADDGLPPL